MMEYFVSCLGRALAYTVDLALYCDNLNIGCYGWKALENCVALLRLDMRPSQNDSFYVTFPESSLQQPQPRFQTRVMSSFLFSKYSIPIFTLSSFFFVCSFIIWKRLWLWFSYCLLLMVYSCTPCYFLRPYHPGKFYLVYYFVLIYCSLESLALNLMNVSIFISLFVRKHESFSFSPHNIAKNNEVEGPNIFIFFSFLVDSRLETFLSYIKYHNRGGHFELM